MHLVDTSIWVRVLNGRPEYTTRMAQLIDRQLAAGHCLVRGELLMGDRGGRGGFLGDYAALPWLPMAPDEEVVMLVQRRSLAGRGIGWIDAHLLASALAGGACLWTADAALQVVARELGVAAEF